MSLVLLNNGIFEEIGESCVIQLDPIFQVTSFESFTDSIENETSDRFFTKEFRYKIGSGGTFSPFLPLTNVNLSNISPSASNVYFFEIKYTRAGTDTAGELIWKCIELDSLRVEACIIIKINKDSYDAKYGESKYVEIIEKIADFNKDMIERELDIVFPVIDNTIVDKSGRDMIIEVQACAKDFNEVLRTLFGNFLTDDLFEIKIDTYDGIRT